MEGSKSPETSDRQTLPIKVEGLLRQTFGSRSDILCEEIFIDVETTKMTFAQVLCTLLRSYLENGGERTFEEVYARLIGELDDSETDETRLRTQWMECAQRWVELLPEEIVPFINRLFSR